MLRFRTIQETVKFLKLLIYGKSGAGKTNFALSAVLCPEMCPVLVLEAEGGLKTVAKGIFADGKKIKFASDKVKVIRIKKWSKFNEVYDYLRDKKNPYKTVVLDSITEYQDLNLKHLIRVSRKTKPDKDEDVADLRDYGKSTIQIKKLVRYFRDLDMNVIFVALSKTTTDESTGIPSQDICLTRRLSEEVPALLDKVGFLRVTKDGVRRLVFRESEKYMAKDRGGELGDYIDNPTVQKILSLMSGETQPIKVEKRR